MLKINGKKDLKSYHRIIDERKGSRRYSLVGCGWIW